MVGGANVKWVEVIHSGWRQSYGDMPNKAMGGDIEWWLELIHREWR